MQTDSCPSGNSLEVENTGNLIPEPLPEDKSNASSSTSEVPVPDSKHQQQQQPQQRQTWGVPPWGLSTTITLMVVWLVVFWFAAYTAVPAVIRICGLESLSGEPRIQVRPQPHWFLVVCPALVCCQCFGISSQCSNAYQRCALCRPVSVDAPQPRCPTSSACNLLMCTARLSVPPTSI